MRERGREGPVRGQRPHGSVHSTRRRGRGRGTAVHQEHNTRRAREQWHRGGCRARQRGNRRHGSGAQTRCHVSSKMSHKPRPSQSPAAEVAPPPRAVRGYGGPGLVGVRVEGWRHPRRCRHPHRWRVRRRSSGKGLEQKGSRGKRRPRQGQEREETRDGRQRRMEGGRRWWQRQLRGRGGPGAASSSEAAGGPVQHGRVDGRRRCRTGRVGSRQHPRGVGG